jgi:hypothetical protein
MNKRTSSIFGTLVSFIVPARLCRRGGRSYRFERRYFVGWTADRMRTGW